LEEGADTVHSTIVHRIYSSPVLLPRRLFPFRLFVGKEKQYGPAVPLRFLSPRRRRRGTIASADPPTMRVVVFSSS